MEMLIIVIGIVLLSALMLLDISEIIDSGLERQRRAMEDDGD